MTNNLRKAKKDLCAFAKKCQGFKYTDSALVTFLITGAVNISNNLFSAESNKSVESQKQVISASIKEMHNKVQRTRVENEKLLKKTNLELTQLMEQGDHVVKSPWSSWQYGVNTYIGDWKGTFKGHGNKKSNQIFERETGTSKYTQKLNNNVYGATRVNLKDTAEPKRAIEMPASINPRVIDSFKITRTAKTVNTPNVPETIDFNPISPTIPSINPAPIVVQPAKLVPYPNSNKYSVLPVNRNITSGTYTLNYNSIDLDNRKPSTTNPNSSANSNNGAIIITEVTANNGHYNLANGVTANINVPGRRVVTIDAGGWDGNLTTASFTNNGIINLNAENTAGLEVQGNANKSINSVINSGTGKIYVNKNESTALLYTQEQTNVPGSVITLQNDGLIEINGNSGASAMNFQNYKGNFVINGATIANDTVGKLINNNKITVNGSSSYGLLFGNTTFVNNKSELSKDTVYENGGTIEVNGDNSGAIVVQKAENWVRGTDPRTDIRIENKAGATIDISGEKAFGIYTEQANATNNGIIKITGSKNDAIGLRAKKLGTAQQTLANNADINILSTGSRNMGLYTDSAIISNTGKINITAGENIGMVADGTGTGTNTNTGKITATSDGSIGTISRGTGTMTNTGIITVTGGNSANNKGTVGVIAGAGSTNDNSGGTVVATVNGDKSIGAYSAGTLKLGTSTITANNGAINYFSDDTSGNIEIASGKTSTAITGDKSLLFYTGGNGTGRFNVAGTLNATIQNGGTAFYYTPGTTTSNGSVTGYNNGLNYGNFGTSDISGYFATTFNGTAGNVHLTMNPVSRLFVASNVKMNLSDTSINPATVTGAPSITGTVGTDYKTFMLYLSELTLDNAVNLDSSTDAYKALEISNSSIINQNTMNGSNNGIIAMAQENKKTDRNYVTLLNDTAGTITLNGQNSVAMYAKNGNVLNSGQITLGGNNSTGLFGTENSKVINNGSGTITLNGTDSTAMYYENTSATNLTSEPMVNDGTINGTTSKSVGMSYNPGTLNTSLISSTALVKNTGTIMFNGDKNTGIFAKADANNSGYTIENAGNIAMVGDSTSLSNPNVGIYTEGVNNKIVNTGTISTEDKTVGIFGYEVENTGNITVGDHAVGIYSQGKDVTLNAGTITTGQKLSDTEPSIGVYVVGDGQNVYANSGANFVIGDGSIGISNGNTSGTVGNYILSNVGNVNLGNGSVYIYSADKLGTIDNHTNISSSSASTGDNFGIYSVGAVNNTGNIDFSAGDGNVGIYVNGASGYAKNSGIINTGKSNTAAQKYAIGMAAKDGATIENISGGVINVNDTNGIGMYAKGAGSKAINRGDINLSGQNAIGMYLDDYAVGENYGNITTTPTSAADGIIGVYTVNNSVIKNYGNISINAVDGIGIYVSENSSVSPEGNVATSGNDSTPVYRASASDTSKGVKGVSINLPYAGATTATVNRLGTTVTPVTVDTNVPSHAPSYVNAGSTKIDLSTFDPVYTVNNGGGQSGIGMYVDTSGVNYTNPISGLQYLTNLRNINLIFGVEATQYTNETDVLVGDNILAPYRTAMQIVSSTNPATKWNMYSGSLTWIATATQDPVTKILDKVYLSKIPYQSFAVDGDSQTYNFLTGLEEKYKTAEGREKLIYDKLNELGKGEGHIFAQAVDEMKGHQYSNAQQRINATGNTLDKEFKYLRDEWRNPSKQNNKIKAFGMKDEYNTDTAGVIDYTSNAYGVAYIHEDEKVKMGNSIGWYAGAVTNRFKFKDIGKSREEQTMLKLGVFNRMSPKTDHNGALQWIVSGDIFAGINNMKRKFWVVDDVFEAKSNYNSYGAALKNELGYDIRMSERTHLRPYGALKMEYGRFNDIKEDSGQIRLEVKGNDYFSVKPEVGMEFKYVQPLAEKTNLSVGLTAAYENELGRLQKGNQARVRYTAADWYNLEKEKEDRKGNGKFDLNIGVDNTRFGVTVNAGYDTKGKNVRGGIGFRAIY